MNQSMNQWGINGESMGNQSVKQSECGHLIPSHLRHEVREGDEDEVVQVLARDGSVEQQRLLEAEEDDGNHHHHKLGEV